MKKWILKSKQEGGKKPTGEKMGVFMRSKDRTLGADGEKAGAKPLTF